jgi:hypothetical protein
MSELSSTAAKPRTEGRAGVAGLLGRQRHIGQHYNPPLGILLCIVAAMWPFWLAGLVFCGWSYWKAP